MKKVTGFLMLVLFLVTASAQDPQAELRKGNELYRKQQYPAAEAAYAEAEKQDPANLSSKFNKANAMHRQNKQSAAIRELDDLSFKSLDNNLKSKSQYNKGVILSGLGKTEEAVEAYKAALRMDPTDTQARENLQKALKELEKKKEQQQDQKKDQKQQEKKQQQQQQPQPQPQMNQKEAEQRLKLLEQKEKEVQQRLQKEKSKQGGGTGKDW
ncbi:MAG: tetratricopeptide repeat protein [Chitinophagaceae bacterium]|nr:MAG: tetratricopeptide repeat protein [Chitinophagaceae bacterium]